MMARDDYQHALSTRPDCNADLPLEDWAVCFGILHTAAGEFSSPLEQACAFHRAYTYSGLKAWLGDEPQPPARRNLAP